MLLTIFYVAATWMHSRRLASLRRNIAQFTNSNSSVVFYKVPKYKSDSKGAIPDFTSSSTFCNNNEKAMIGELLHFSGDLRSCSLHPQQIVNVDNWITFPEETTFPVKVSSKKALLKDERLFVLIEAACSENTNPAETHSCTVSQIGIPRAWRADTNLGLIIESDLDHFLKISSSFLTFPMFVDSNYEICRIQTIGVKGKPCIVLNSKLGTLPKSPSVQSQIFSYDSPSGEWPREPSLASSPLQWKNHIELLRSFSQCANQSAQGNSVLVPEHESASISPGNKTLKLDSPTVIEIPVKEESSIKEEFIVRKWEKVEVESSLINGKSNEIQTRSSSTAALESDSTPKTSCDSSTVVSAQSTPSKQDLQTRKNTFSSVYSLGSASTLSIRSNGSGKSKPPNVLIYTESPALSENIKTILNETLHKHKYTIYNITGNQLGNTVWASNCFLLVICGNVPQQVEPLLISYLIQGGRLFCLCSSFLHTLLPTFRTAEVRERELVYFTYGRWRRVRLMHHVFCYQNSPARTKFSREADEPPSEKDRVSPVPQTPSSVEVIDNNGVSHTLHVQVLGVEETWQTPSLILAYFAGPGGRAVFSQVHLELDPSETAELEEEEALRRSEIFRKEIIKDILSTHLGLEVGGIAGPASYTVACFLGRHETKLNFLEKIKHLLQDGVLKLGPLGLKFCGKGETPPPATATLLPVLVHSCPRDFSTVDYFENLKTKSLGRLLIYSEVLGSSMDVVNGELAHGLAVVPSQQTSGKGRTTNQWLSPPGCAMFSLQIHFPTDSYMGRHASVLQHVVAVAIVSSLAEMSPDYKKAFDLHLKWPNDLYTGGSVKIGGLIANCSNTKNTVICNVGCGINLDNELPTTCLNKLIEEYNKANHQKLKKLSREKLLANVFNQLEKILDKINEGDIEHMKHLYYEYWLHGGVTVTVLDQSGNTRSVTIRGIDEFGFLEVREKNGNIFTVHPDGNSFDMMEGLIAPKLN